MRKRIRYSDDFKQEPVNQLVDQSLLVSGYNAVLANPTACAQQYSGLKYSDDKHDAFWLAHMQ